MRAFQNRIPASHEGDVQGGRARGAMEAGESRRRPFECAERPPTRTAPRRASSLVLAAILAAASCRGGSSPERTAQPGPAPKPPVPAVGTGRIEPAGDPIEPLRTRTYFFAPRGDLLYAGTTAGVVVWTIADRANPSILGTAVLPGEVSSLAILGPEGKLVAAATGPTGVALLDASSAMQGKLDVLAGGGWSSAGGCHAAWRVRAGAEGRILVACGSAGLAEADIGDPSSPRVMRIVPAGGYVRDMAVLEGEPLRVAVAAGIAGIAIIELPAGGAPALVSRLETPGEARAIEVSGTMAFVADGPSGLLVVDLSDPAHPAVKGSYDPHATDMARGIAVALGRAYLCLGDSGIAFVDVTDPSSPRKAGGFDPGRAVNRVAVEGSFLYAANDDAGLLVLDVTDPASPVQVFPSPKQADGR